MRTYAHWNDRPADHPVCLQNELLGVEFALANFGGGCSVGAGVVDYRPRWARAGFAGAAVFACFGAVAVYPDWVGLYLLLRF